MAKRFIKGGNELITYKITETKERYHTLTLEDDVDIEQIMDIADTFLSASDDWDEAIQQATKLCRVDSYSVTFGEKIVRLDAEEI